jgi:hypothetical protein
MLLNTNIFVESLEGKKLDVYSRTDLYNKLMYSLNESQMNLDDFDIEIERRINDDGYTTGIVVVDNDKLEIYTFEKEGLMVDLSHKYSHGYGNKQIILPKYYQEGNEMENMIVNSPDVVKEQMADELGASQVKSDANPIHFHLDKMSWENVDVSLEDLDFYLSKKSLSELFNDEDDFILGSFNIEFKMEEVVISSDRLEVLDYEEGNTYFSGLYISMSRELYKDMEKELMI